MRQELKEWGWMAVGFGVAVLIAWLGVTAWTVIDGFKTRDRITRIEREVFPPKVSDARAVSEGVVPSTGNPPQSQPGPSGGQPGNGNSGKDAPLPQDPGVSNPPSSMNPPVPSPAEQPSVVSGKDDKPLVPATVESLTPPAAQPAVEAACEKAAPVAALPVC